MGLLEDEAQAQAVRAAQMATWQVVCERFNAMAQTHGLRAVHLSRRLGVSRPQIHAWLTEPHKMTLKAAARLLLAMDAEFACAARPAEKSTDLP